MLDTIVVVDGAPIVSEKKVDALSKVLKKLFSEAGRIRDDTFYMPLNEEGKSKGYVFIGFETPEQADRAIRGLNNKRLDAKHTLLVNRFTDIERYGEDDEEEVYEEPVEEEYHEQEYLRDWLKEPNCVDQFVLHRNETVGVYWNRRGEHPETIVSREKWTETYVAWSPLGSYLCSVHRQGVQLWGSNAYERKQRFMHPGVQLLDFSPCENYIVTWSPEPIQMIPEDSPMRAQFPFTPADEGKQIVVWNVKTGLPVRTFSAAVAAENEAGAGPAGPKKISWPAFKWTSDDKYLARCVQGQQIFVYETPGMGLVDKKSIKIDGVVDFEWSPATMSSGTSKKTEEHVLSFWTPEMNNQSARVTLMTIPSKEVVRTRNLFNVADCRLHWQSQGDFLCVKVVRFTKTKKATFTNLEFFRLREKNIPIEVVELKDTVMNFAWEPAGDRLVIISTSDAPAAAPTFVSFYGLERSKGVNGQFRQVASVERKSSNSIFWSPKGRFVVVASVGGTSNNTGELDFWDFDFEGERKEVAGAEDVPANLVLMSTGQHYQLTDIAWDPTGRFVATSSSTWGRALETGYRVWDLKGTLVREEHLERFKQFLWRPRPPTLLSKEQMREVRKNLREYSKVFEQEDLAEESQASKELIAQRIRLLEEWRAWRKAVVAELEAERGGVVPLAQRGSEKEDEVIERIVEDIVSEKEEIIE
ncbi:eukaryotic translation initiation factor 3 subunit B [Myxozyma melibiosi]|uniref:Eukaryotic translation initiation factor 3 subunit B n=1 Tax=Myxozyma melibiosi TaxID=54550 RepID=A0ABR1F9J4_9ASCO